MRGKKQPKNQAQPEKSEFSADPSLLEKVAESLPIGTLILSRTGEIVFANRAARASLTDSSEPILGLNLFQSWNAYDHTGNHLGDPSSLIEQLKTDTSVTPQIQIAPASTDSDVPPQELTIRSVATEGTKIDFFLGTFMDDQAREQIRRLEERLLKTQRAQSVGRLAGGIAHNLNSILSPVIGYTDMALQNLHPKDPLFHQMKEIRTATERATDLIRQLLAYGRKQTIRLRQVDLSTVVEHLQTILRQSIREEIEIKYELEKPIHPIHADSAQVQQIVVNLVLNSSEAIPQRGKIFIRTTNCAIDADSAEKGMAPGAYVLLQVADTGKGMKPDVLNHVFEPFFTTKEIGEGTGLGLSTVYGIVKQHGGHINVSSKPGKGSIFKIYFPKSNRQSVPSVNPAVVPTEAAGRKTILVVEDEDSLLRFTCLVLRKVGYTVISAGSGPEAIDKARDFNGTIHLLLTDVIMPRMNGKELYETLSKSHPEMKILYTSGYPDDVIARHGIIDKSEQLLTKPTTVQKLTEKVQKVLEG